MFVTDNGNTIGNMAKRRISKRRQQEYKAHQIFRKTNITYPLIRTRTYVCVSGSKKHSFFGKFGLLCIFVTSVLRFALLLYYRRYHITHKILVSTLLTLYVLFCVTLFIKLSLFSETSYELCHKVMLQ